MKPAMQAVNFLILCSKNGAWRKGPPFHGSRSRREIKSQNANCQMGCRKITGRQNCFFLQENDRWRSYREINQHPSLPWNFVTHGFLDPSAFPERSRKYLDFHNLDGLPLVRTLVAQCSANPRVARSVFGRMFSRDASGASSATSSPLQSQVSSSLARALRTQVRQGAGKTGATWSKLRGCSVTFLRHL